MVTTQAALRAVDTPEGGKGLRFSRFFTSEGVHPYDELEWELRDAVIKDWKTGGVAFEQRDVEFPTSWSLNATTIVAQKYFRGPLGSPRRERSVRQMVDRVADTISGWGRDGGYFADEESAEVFNHELKHLLVTQRAAFNSPVWFNVGVEETPQCSACFILSVEDTMSSILNWYVEEGTIFKGGSGSGVNLSRIRSSKEQLRAGGQASGPVSFMRGADASAGTIKSGGKTRRAAKMVILNVDHPDVEEFIWCKQREELKARALREAGFDMDLDGLDSGSIQYQNANNSVRVTDDFMRAVEAGSDFALRAVTTGETVRTLPARDLMRQIAQAAWECADPGMQYDTTINDWHTTPNAGRINGSNPCFTGDALVHTDKGLIRFDELLARVNDGESFGVYTHDATSPTAPAERMTVTRPDAFMITGRNPIVKLTFSNGMELRCTPTHKIFTSNRGYVVAGDLQPDDRVKVLNLATPASTADRKLPVSSDIESYRHKGDQRRLVRLPEKWDTDLAEYLGWLVGDGSVSGNVVSTIYGSREEQDEVLPPHRRLATWLNGDVSPTPSRQANGTVQLRLSRAVLRRFFEALGVTGATAAHKVVPWSVMQAPPDAVAGFLRGLFDADGCVHDGAKYPYVGLGSPSHALVVGVQRLLSTLGITSRIYATQPGPGSFSYRRKDGSVATYQGTGTAYDLRIAGRSLEVFAAEVGFSLPSKRQRLEDLLRRHARYRTDETTRLVQRTEDGFELTYNLSEPRNHSYVVNGVVVRNCSEYMHLDNSACNLASLNLRKFEAGGVFDVEAFRHAVEVVFTAQEIIVGNSSYPTEKIAANAKAYRQLGLGYANLGGLLMSQGLAYDSEEGRAWAAAITALMTGHAYRTSAEIAKVTGPFEGFAADRDGMLRVIAKHKAAAEDIDAGRAPANILAAARESWAEALVLGRETGIRNAQSSVLAPTGTIGLMMDCDTTGIEPDLGLVKAKKLVGGGTMRIVNRTVPAALEKLGYQPEQIEAIVAYIDEHGTIDGAPAFRDEHLEVFDCAMGERSIRPMGHVNMMAAVQPFLSGAISKCVVGETLVPTGDGLIRIGGLHHGEAPDTFREQILEVASLDGPAKTDAFYYGGLRNVRRAVLRSGHSVTGTDNHRVLVAGDGGLRWRYLDELEPGEYAATQYGTDLWSPVPAPLRDFVPSAPYGSQKKLRLPEEMTEELAFLLGAYAAEGHTSHRNGTVTITNSVEAVLQRVVAAWRAVFGIDARIVRQPGKCPAVMAASKTVVEFFDYLGAGSRAADKRIPDAVLRSPKAMVLAFLQGLALDAYPATMGRSPKWAICPDSPGMLDDLQAVLTNLGIVHGRVTKRNRECGKTYDEVYAVGQHEGLRFSPVVSVEDVGQREVFDLSVPSTHAFVGNGIVNHNTVNLPESATVEDVEELYLEGWRLGLKALAIYRDNCKVAQPLAIAKKQKEQAAAAATEEAASQHGIVRRRLPKQRPSQTISFQVGDAEGYLTAGEYPGDGLGEIFVKLGKQGSTLSGVMDAFAISVSLGLQYGVPLEAYVRKFTNMRFEPSGMTDDPEVRFTSSLVDYIFRRLAIEYLPADKRQELGIYTIDERMAAAEAPAAPAPSPEPPAAPPVDATGQTVLPVDKPVPVDDLYGDAPMCYQCGVKMRRAGSCHACEQCGTTSGCS